MDFDESMCSEILAYARGQEEIFCHKIPKQGAPELPVFQFLVVVLLLGSLPHQNVFHTQWYFLLVCFCFKRMAQKKYLIAKLTSCLREDKIQLWKPPYTNDKKEAGEEMKVNIPIELMSCSPIILLVHFTRFFLLFSQELVQKYSSKLKINENDAENMLEEIRCKAIERGTGNENYKVTGIARLDIHLPRRKVSDVAEKLG